MRKFLLILFTVFFFNQLNAQQEFFSIIGSNSQVEAKGKREIFPQKFITSKLEVQQVVSFLKSLPRETAAFNHRQAPVLELPMPDGKTARFHVWESSMMEPGLQEKFPEIRTFAGQGIDDPYATIRFDFNPYTGFHAQILSPVNGRVFIDPYSKGDLTYYMSYRSSEYTRDVQHLCNFIEEQRAVTERNQAPLASCLGITRRTYRLALSCTGEYAAAVCAPSLPTVPVTLAAMVVSMNRVNGVYEKEVVIRMNLIANNDQLIFLDGATDPFTNNDGGAMLGQNQTTVDNIIGSANYDIGHVFSTGGGGIASLRSPCNNGLKARGVTGQPNPIGDGFDIDYVAHEMGHQWGANHSMAGCGSSPNNTKLEPGSGTTIMAYAGICGGENIQPNSDAYFHAISFDEISNYINGGGNCGVNTSTGNTLPIINSLPFNGVSVPVSTPFVLNATATDADGDALSYCWEQFDASGLGNTTWNAGATGAPGNTLPLFRSRNPKTTGERSFPDIRVIRAGFPANPPSAMDGLKGETLSPVTRPMKFRLTVRDNRAGGGSVVSSGTDGCQTNAVFQVNVAGTAPFTITAPNGGESFPAGSSQTVTWNVSGTNAAPFNAPNVRITLSTDGGLTYPTVVTASTSNDGSETVVIPSVAATTTARMKVEAIGNIFYDISNADFSISAPVTGFDFNAPAPQTTSCPAPANLDIALSVTSANGFVNPVTLTATGNPAGTTVAFLPSNIVTPGNSVTVRLNNTNTLTPGTYNITINGTTNGAPNRSRTISYIINAGSGPVISTNPNNETVCAGSNITFTAAAPGALSQQWQVSTDGGAIFSNITGATQTTLTLTNVTVGLNNNRYRCVFTGLCNNSNSNAAQLTVQQLPSISTQPVNLSLCAGTGGNFSIAASGTGVNYQWQVSTDGGANFTNINGATGSSLSLTNVTVAQNNNRYRCQVSGSCTPALTSNEVTLTVASPINITIQPADQTFCGSGDASFAVIAGGSNINYQWQLSTDGGTTYNNISGASAFSLSVPATSTAFNGSRYRVVLSNNICPTVTSSPALLTVNPVPSIVLSAAPYNKLFPGLRTTVSATVSPSAGVSLVWRKNGVVFPNTGTTLSVTLDELGSYSVTGTGPGGCTGQSNSLSILDSATSKIFIYPNPNNGQFQVRYYNPVNPGTTNYIRIFDAKGTKVFEKQYSVVRSYDQMFADIRARGTGIYLVELSDANGKRLSTTRVLIQ
jgi:hypothetical protein